MCCRSISSIYFLCQCQNTFIVFVELDTSEFILSKLLRPAFSVNGVNFDEVAVFIFAVQRSRYWAKSRAPDFGRP